MEADRRDLQSISEVYTANWKRTYRGLLPQSFLDGLTVERAAEQWRTYLTGDRHGIFVAYHQGIFWGFGAYRPDEEYPDCLYLDALHVPEEARGQGVGTALIKAIGYRAVADGYERLSICVIRGNESARKLYTKLGAVHDKYFIDAFHGTPANSEKLIWQDLSVFANREGA